MGSFYGVQNEKSVNRGFLDRDYLYLGFDVIDGLDYRLDDMGGRTFDKSVNDVALNDGNTNDALSSGIQAEELT